ncbi:MerR family transcriptional regulator [Arthrobacter sp. NQ7]|uniref:MerR family transcriptional regulator n=1 Tax=Arthrobacter sp. NQ7 TaxID=3032303 RepID=UPI00240EABC3|nr:MerR family transcriptional regulator [Arthrobacter sp. NQ7]MDJ0459680.1 MerR family transcriptional regulator [Arthrobacter sp. NQ7]
MRISQLAEITGTTPRTVRYYHQIGLLPVPSSRHGYRDYGFEHVARMLHIRWVADGGVPLDRLPDFIGVGGSSTSADAAADLEAALEAVTRRIEELTVQQAHVARLLRIVESGSALTPLPLPLVRLYEEIENRTSDEAVRRGIRGERELLEVAAYRGVLPEAVTAFAVNFYGSTLEEALELFGELQHLGERTEGLSAGDVAAAIDSLAARTVELIARAGGMDLADLISPFEGHVPPDIMELVTLVFPGHVHRLFLTAVTERAGILAQSRPSGGSSRTAPDSTAAEVARR